MEHRAAARGSITRHVRHKRIELLSLRMVPVVVREVTRVLPHRVTVMW